MVETLFDNPIDPANLPTSVPEAPSLAPMRNDCRQIRGVETLTTTETRAGESVQSDCPALAVHPALAFLHLRKTHETASVLLKSHRAGVEHPCSIDPMGQERSTTLSTSIEEGLPSSVMRWGSGESLHPLSHLSVATGCNPGGVLSMAATTLYDPFFGSAGGD